MAQVQLTTDTKNIQASPLLTTVTTTVPSRTITNTQPVTTVASGIFVTGSSLNYLKMKAYSSSNSVVLTITVTGWSYLSSANAYVPQTLCVVTTGQNTNSQAVLGSTLYEVSSYVKTIGDCKIYNSPDATSNGAFIMIDLLGCQFIEFHCSSASSTQTVHILTSGL